MMLAVMKVAALVLAIVTTVAPSDERELYRYTAIPSRTKVRTILTMSFVLSMIPRPSTGSPMRP